MMSNRFIPRNANPEHQITLGTKLIRIKYRNKFFLDATPMADNDRRDTSTRHIAIARKSDRASGPRVLVVERTSEERLRLILAAEKRTDWSRHRAFHAPVLVHVKLRYQY